VGGLLTSSVPPPPPPDRTGALLELRWRRTYADAAAVNLGVQWSREEKNLTLRFVECVDRVAPGIGIGDGVDRGRDDARIVVPLTERLNIGRWKGKRVVIFCLSRLRLVMWDVAHFSGGTSEASLPGFSPLREERCVHRPVQGRNLDTAR
jgi:hypothetical protein